MGLGKVFSTFGRGLVQEVRENKLKYWFLLSAVLVIGAAGTVGFWEYANSPTFCTSCHDMKGFAEAINNSKHKDVSCVDCHLPPGFINHVKFKVVDGMLSGVFFLTGKAPTKANAHVSEDNCKRCHEGKIESMQARKFKGLPFDHKKHVGKVLPVGGFDLQCTTCHRQTTEEVHIDVSKEVCAECHHNMKDAKRCEACHQPEEVSLAGGDFSHEKGKGQCKSCHTSIEPPYDPDFNCIRCHARKATLDTPKTAEKMHEIHVNDRAIHFKVECFECHGLALPQAKAGAYVKKNLFMHKFHISKQKMDCLDCHSGNKRPVCTDCH